MNYLSCTVSRVTLRNCQWVSRVASETQTANAAPAVLFLMPSPPDGKEKTRLLQYHRPGKSEATNYIKEETRK